MHLSLSIFIQLHVELFFNIFFTYKILLWKTIQFKQLHIVP